MGHYDSCYDYDDRIAREAKARTMLEFRKESEDLLKKARMLMPTRFMDSLEDMINYCKVRENVRGK